jgi:hypothetical protein
MGMQTGSAHPGDRNFTVILRQIDYGTGLLSNWRNGQGARIHRIRWLPEISILSERDQNYPDFVQA